MRSRINNNKSDTSNYDLSISDLMSALCCIFILFLAVTVYKFNQQKGIYEMKNEIATQYKDMQKELYNALNNEFQADLDNWSADISNVDGAIRIRFTNDSFMFKGGEAMLQPQFEEVLSSFFGRLIKIVASEEFRDDILEIRIEGHTLKLTGDDEDYRVGMDLSMERTKNVLIYCLENSIFPFDKIGETNILQWVRERIVAIGYSNSIPGDDPTKSRRVEFKIRTKAEETINQMEIDPKMIKWRNE